MSLNDYYTTPVINRGCKMGVHTITHACGHDYEYNLSGNARTRENRVELLAAQPCPDCRRVAQYERLARDIIAERDARKENAEPDKIAPNGKKRPSKDMSQLLRSSVYINNATRNFVIVDARELDEDALFLDGYFYCCKLLVSDEKINAEISRFQNAAGVAEKLAGVWDTPEIQEERRAINAEDCFSEISDEKAVAALYKYWYIDRPASLPPVYGVWDDRGGRTRTGAPVHWH